MHELAAVQCVGERPWSCGRHHPALRARQNAQRSSFTLGGADRTTKERSNQAEREDLKGEKQAACPWARSRDRARKRRSQNFSRLARTLIDVDRLNRIHGPLPNARISGIAFSPMALVPLSIARSDDERPSGMFGGTQDSGGMV